MTITHDIFAETNPVFCAVALMSFSAAFISVNQDGPELPACYIALPIALSGELDDTFDGTNKKTGLLEWLTRSPQVQVGLASRINASENIITDAVRFGCFAHILSLNENGRIYPRSKNIKKSAFTKIRNGSSKTIKHAERLGYWFAMAGSSKAVFNIMGLTV